VPLEGLIRGLAQQFCQLRGSLFGPGLVLFMVGKGPVSPAHVGILLLDAYEPRIAHHRVGHTDDLLLQREMTILLSAALQLLPLLLRQHPQFDPLFQSVPLEDMDEADASFRLMTFASHQQITLDAVPQAVTTAAAQVMQHPQDRGQFHIDGVPSLRNERCQAASRGADLETVSIP